MLGRENGYLFCGEIREDMVDVTRRVMEEVCEERKREGVAIM